MPPPTQLFFINRHINFHPHTQTKKSAAPQIINRLQLNINPVPVTIRPTIFMTTHSRFTMLTMSSALSSHLIEWHFMNENITSPLVYIFHSESCELIKFPEACSRFNFIMVKDGSDSDPLVDVAWQNTYPML